jgi:hypothetical protein
MNHENNIYSINGCIGNNEHWRKTEIAWREQRILHLYESHCLKMEKIPRAVKSHNIIYIIIAQNITAPGYLLKAGKKMNQN